MVQYRDLNAPPSRMLADVVADMKAQERQSKTGDAGVKDLGESGDVVWPRPDGTPVSVRDVDLDLADARQRIEDAEGDLAGAQARIDTALDAEGHIREDEILRNATLLGETVVEQINVTDKLVGVDGVFTGTVDFANVNVTGELLANEISGEHIYGTVIEGGEIRSTDGLPQQVVLSDTAFTPHFDNGGTPRPGIRINTGSGFPVYKPGVGPVSGGGIAVYSGRNSSNQWGALTVKGAETRILNDGGDGRTAGIEVFTGAIYTYLDGPAGRNGIALSPGSSQLYSPHSQIEANRDEAFLKTSAGGTGRALLVDANGVWAKQGSTSVSLVPQVRPFQYSAIWNADQSPAPIMVQHLPGGKLCQAQIRIQNLTGSSLSLPNETWVTLNYNPIPSDLRGGFTDYIETTLPQSSARGRIEMNYSTGSIRIRNISGTNISWTNNNSIWFPMRWFSPN